MYVLSIFDPTLYKTSYAKNKDKEMNKVGLFLVLQAGGSVIPVV